MIFRATNINFSFTPEEPKYYRIALVANTSNDTNLDNNEYRRGFTAYLDKADIDVYNLIIDDPLIVNQTTNISFTIENDGIKNATNVVISFYIGSELIDKIFTE